MDLAYYGQLLVTGVTVGAIYAAAALGFVIVFRVTGILNFAQGEFLMVGAFLMVSLRSAGWALLPAMAMVILAAAVLGSLVHLGTIRPASGRSTHLSILLITVGVSQILMGAAQLVWGEDPRYTDPYTPRERPYELFGITVSPQSLWIIGGVLAAVGVLWLVLEKTGVGRALRACASNPEMAQLVGINVHVIAMLSFAAAGALGGLAGLLLVPAIGVSVATGATLAVKGIAAAVIGGFGSFPGAVVGGIALGLLESFGSLISSGLSTAIALSAVLLVLLVFPSGLLGGRSRVASPKGV